MDKQWLNHISSEREKPYFKELEEFIKKRRSEAQVIPGPAEIFLPFKITEWNHLKVIILGQDPYPSSADSHGLAFSSLAKQTPYSLQNIFNEIYSDIYEGNSGGIKVFQTNNLTSWAKQGVLLLNMVLTTEAGSPGSHKNKGWEEFIKSVVKMLNERHTAKLVWMLWGKSAKEMKKYIDQEKHLVLESEHPSAMRNDPNAFINNRHFSKCNNFIKKHYFNLKSPINWHLIP